MAVHVKVGDLEATENNGVVESMRRSYLVTGIDASSGPNLLWQALTANGIPVDGQQATGDSNLVCTGRQVKVLNNSKTQCEVFVEYRARGAADRFIFSGGTSLTSTVTQVDAYRNQVVVSHTWPDDDPDPDLRGFFDSQPIDLSVMQPQSTLVATGMLRVAYPDHVSRLWTGSMNSAAWASAGPYEYLCTRVDWNPLDVGFGKQRKWMFRFEFQHDYTTWVPQVFFTDPRTNKPAKNLIPGLGMKQIDWYGLLDFNALFPVR